MTRRPSSSQRLERMVGELRDSRLSFRDIAQEARLSHSTIWRASLGQLREPSFDTFEKIQAACEKALGRR